MKLQDESEQRLLELARPNAAQRALRAVGCPGMLWLGYCLAKFATQGLMADQPLLGWLLAVAVFVVATPILLAVVASISSFSLRHARAELRRRLGQDDFSDAISILEQEVHLLPAENRGWVALIRGQLVTASQRVHVRLDLRDDESFPTAHIESVRGPKLNVFDTKLQDLASWHRSERDLQADEACELAAVLDSLGPDSMSDANAGSKLWLDIALLRVGEQRTTSRCRVRVNRPDQSEFAILALIERAWLLSDWATDAP